jgi:polyvinyl alcohol dehydrogenase (cytochrome)
VPRIKRPAASARLLLLCAGAVAPALALGADCPDPSAPVAVGTGQWTGWGRDVENSRYQPEPAIRATDVARLRFKWAFGYGVQAPTAGAAPAPSAPAASATVDAQPTVVDGRLFVTSPAGRVSALDAATGCTYWSFDADAGVRTATVVGELQPARKPTSVKKSRVKKKDAHIDVEIPPSALFFGDDSGAVYALDARTGRLLWKTQADAHPLARIAGSPTLYKSVLYVPVAAGEAHAAANPSYPCCTFRGSVAAINIVTGQILWRTFMTAEQPKPYKTSEAGTQLYQPAGMAISAAPAIDADHEMLYVAVGRSFGDLPQATANAIVALNLADGKIAWTKQLPKADAAGEFDGAPVLRSLSLSREVLVAAPKSADAYGLDPSRGGEILWRSKLEIAGAGAVQWGPAADHRSVYLAYARAADGAAAPSGGLVALDIATGRLRWSAPSPQPPCGSGMSDCAHLPSQAVTVIPGIAFLGSLDGHLRAYSTIDGKVLWDVDTARSYETANAVSAKGGPLERGGAVVAAGMVFVNSGDALLAFSIDGK